MKRFVLALFPALLMLALTAMPAGAGVQWCRTDPIVAFNDTEVNIWLAIPEQWESAVTGPAEFTITVPSDVSREVVLLDAGLNDMGETVTFVDKAPANGGAYTVEVYADVPMAIDPLPFMDVPMLLSIDLPDDRTIDFEGTSKTGVSGSFEMEPVEAPV